MVTSVESALKHSWKKGSQEKEQELEGFLKSAKTLCIVQALETLAFIPTLQPPGQSPAKAPGTHP